MAKYDIILLTESRYENPIERDDYINNVLLEDELVLESLRKKGLYAKRVDWARQDFDWSEARFLLFRTTWDYFYKWTEFSDWLDKTKIKSQFINPISTIRWNLDKHYLLDMQANGVNIAPTKIIKQGSSLSLESEFKSSGMKEIVLKPLVSGGGRHTYRIDESNVIKYSSVFASLILEEDMMIQEFQKNVPIEGELSLMFFGGRYSHAILKKAKKDDFRVQDDFGGSVHDHIASKEEIEFATFAIQQVNPVPVYGRVDIFRDNNNELALAELELIEPELWFRNHPPAADMLAEEIVKLFST